MRRFRHRLGLVLWLVAASNQPLTLALYRDDDGRRQVADDTIVLDSRHRRDLRIGEHAWMIFIDVDLGAAGVELHRARGVVTGPHSVP